MSEEAKMSMMLCEGLERAEEQKVVRLDGAISEKFIRAGCVGRIFCRGRIDGDRRVLDFCGPAGILASVWASEFLAASDTDAVAMVTIGSFSKRAAAEVTNK